VFDRRRGGLDLGYAVTSYAVQGSTRGASTSAITATTARSELYVDITRGRASKQLYATSTTTGTEEVHLPRLDSDLLTELRGRLARGLVRTALAVDPDALAIARIRQGRDLPGLAAARRRGEAGPFDAAIQRASTAIRQLARTHPPDNLRAVLPPRPVSPHLAARWDTVAGDLAIRHALAPLRPHRQPAGDPLHRALGARPAAHNAEAWDRVTLARCCSLTPPGNNGRSRSSLWTRS
jgi:hypothetical protein